jgi:vesicle coat complex subunit|tara:strand:+ start:163 stop:477 length:315 start_codon:yes stop_codon:yes gene_type:complete
MSEINELVEQIKQSTDYQTNKRILREKIKTDLHVTHNNGLFLVTTELIAFLATWPDDELFLEDTYQNPINVNRQEFLTKCQEHYQMVMNTWHIEHEQLKRQRKV